MVTANDVLRIARKELGYIEEYQNLTKYGNWYGMDGVPWCAIFVSYCFYQAGMPLRITTDKGFAFCPYGVHWFQDKDRWFIDSPQVGDIVFFNWSGDGVAEHVGIVEFVKANGWIGSIEGNTSPRDNSNGGEVMQRDRSPQEILGFARPPYSDGSGEKNHEWMGRNITLTTPYTEGAEVMKWQQQMISLGYNLGSGGSTGKGDDGVFGQLSYAALKEFQKGYNLKPDGILGILSWNAAWSQRNKPTLKTVTLLAVGETPIRKLEGQSAFFYQAGMSIDADGAPNAYHPQDEGIDFLANAGYPGNWWGIVAAPEPIIQGSSDPYPGYYVSTTALTDSEFKETDPRRYVNSADIPYIVLPGNGDLRKATDVRLGDLAVVYNTMNEQLAFAIYADVGPKNQIGEGSIALAQALGHDPFVNGKVRRGIDKGIIYLVFPGSGNSKPRTVAEIISVTQPLFEAWGGLKRLLTL